MWLGSFGCFFAVGLAAAGMALANLSGGTVRKIELKNKKLAERLEKWLNKRDELRVVIRLLLIFDCLFLLLCLASWEGHCIRLKTALWLRFAPPLAGSLFFFLITEWIGHHLPSLTTGRFLTISIPLIRVLGIVVMPLTLPVFVWQRWVTEWQKKHTEDEEKATAEDEIMSLVEQDALIQEKDSALEDDERRMIRGIFDLDETLVHEIMTPRVDLDAVECSATIAEMKAKIIASGHSRIPVYHKTIDQIVGVVYAKDLLDDEKRAENPLLKDLFHLPVFIPETKNIGDLLNECQQNRNHFAIVLDEYGGTAGIVTFEDILEEIVGEIRDEYDINEICPTTQALPDGNLVVDARTTINELNDALDLELPEDDDFDTLGGYISAHAGRIPQAGETLETDMLSLEIISADPRRVLKAKVKRKLDGTESVGE